MPPGRPTLGEVDACSSCKLHHTYAQYSKVQFDSHAAAVEQRSNTINGNNKRGVSMSHCLKGVGSKAVYRPDIDGLRALAVVAVIINHYFPQVLPLGSLGVDVFFVISGFVITQGLVTDRSTSWSEFFLSFYARRIRRLLPALLFCVLVTVALLLILTARPEQRIFITGGLSLFGLSNVYLYHIASDYFTVDAHLNPFTHTWSLGVEEQFYFIYPALILVCGFAFLQRGGANLRARRLMLCLGGLSLIAYLLANAYNTMLAFYMVIPRFWEFCAGSLVYLTLSIEGNSQLPARLCSKLAVGCMLVLLLSMLLPSDYLVIGTLLSVITTAGLIFCLTSGQWLYNVLACSPVVFIGLASYSLYLWHWPVLVIGKYVVGDSLLASLLLLIISIILALLAYFFVEKRFRYSSSLQGNLRAFAFLFLLVMPASLFVAFKAPGLETKSFNFASLFNVQQVDSWAGQVPCTEDIEATAGEAAEGVYIENCLKPNRNAEKPNVLFLLGDSHAAHLTFMLNDALSQFPMEMRFVLNASKTDFPRSFLDGNPSSATFDTLLRHARAGDVVMLALHRGRLNARRDMHIPLSQPVELGSKGEHLLGALKGQIDTLLARGVKIILVRDTPLMSVFASSEACHLQKKLFGKSACVVSREQDMHTRQRLDQVFDALAQGRTQVHIWDPAPYFFAETGFADVVDANGEYVMMDANHITRRQSEKLAPAFVDFFKQRILQ